MVWSFLSDESPDADLGVLPPFSSELPHETFQDIDQGILLLQTRRSKKARFAVGCAWLVEPVNIDVLAETDCLALAHQHQDFLIGLPVGTALQTIMTICPTTTAPAWEAFHAQFPSHPSIQAQRRAIQQGLWHAQGTMHACLRDIHNLVTLRYPLTAVDPRLSTAVRTLLSGPPAYGAACTEALQELLAQAVEQFREMRGGFEDAMRHVGHGVTALDAVGLGHALQTVLDPMQVRPHPVIEPTYPLGEQVLHLEAEILDRGLGMRFGTTDPVTQAFREESRARVLSLKRAIPQTYPGMCSAPRTPTGFTTPMNLWNAWHYPVSIVINTAVTDETSEAGRLDNKALLARWQRKIRTENKTILKAIKKFKKHQLLSGSQIGSARVHFVVWGHEQNLARGVGRVKRAAENLKMVLIDEPTLGTTLFLQCLPLGYDPAFPREAGISRVRRQERETLMHYLTLYGSFRGVGDPVVSYLNQLGQLVPFNPRKKDTNPHLIIAGTSGGGKTYSIGHYVHHSMAVPGIGVLLDPLENFRGLCEYWEGELISLDPKKPLFINPFHGSLDDDHVTFLAALLNEMMSSGVDRLNVKEFAVLCAALKYFARTWDHAHRGEPQISHFAREVLDNGCFNPDYEEAQAIGRQLALKLSPYYGEGLYAKFFDGPNAFTFTKRLTLIEFARLDTAEELKGVLFFALFHLITKRFESSALAGIPKTIVGDELWKFLKHRPTAEVIEKIIRTYRNFDAQAIFASQRAKDFQSPVGEIIRDIADTTLFLKPGAGELPVLTSLFDLTPAEVEVFRHVGKHRGWASAYLRTGHGEGGIVRIIPDALFDTLMSQSDLMKAKRATLRAKYGTLSPSIPELRYAI